MSNKSINPTFSIKLVWSRNGRGSVVCRKIDFVKKPYLRKRKLEYHTKTELVRFFMDYFKDREYTSHEIKAVTHFLKRVGLSRAERHAVVLHLGHHYYPRTTKEFQNLKINGYFEHKSQTVLTQVTE